MNIGTKASTERAFTLDKSTEAGRNGIEIYHGDKTLPDVDLEHVALESRCFELGIWRPRASVNCIRQLQRGSTLIVGRAGAGKGAVLNGIRVWCQAEGVSYLFIDGHYEKKPLLLDILRQYGQTHLLLIDSFDYFYGGTRRLRRMSEKKFHALMKEVFSIISGAPLVLGTIHNNLWADNLGDKELLAAFNDLTIGYFNFLLSEAFETQELAYQFLLNKGLTQAEALRLLQVRHNDTVRELFFRIQQENREVARQHAASSIHLFSGDWPDYLYGDGNRFAAMSLEKWELFLELLGTYSVLKLITQDVFGEHEALLELMRGDDDEAFWRALFDYVFEKDKRLTFHAVLR